VKNMMLDRQHHSEAARTEINAMWSGKQKLIGPILEIPYIDSNKVNKNSEEMSYFYVLPENLDIRSELIHEVRARGMFETVLYIANLKLEGDFNLKNVLPKGVEEGNVIWNSAKIVMSVSDTKGIKQADLVNQTEKTAFRTHTKKHHCHGLEQTMSCALPVEKGTNQSFSIQMQLSGSEDLGIIPVGEATTVEVQSDWHSPSFSGQFLPDTREIGSEGFSAKWKVSGLSRGLPQSWSKQNINLKKSELKIRLLMPVGAYSKSLRIVSYAFLFVAFTFGAMFCAERISGVGIHILQYLVAGIAIIIFYVLLLSLAEQIAFIVAYVAAASIILLMIVTYIRAILRSRGLTLALGGMLVLLYSYFYVVLQCEDYALLTGSVGLVVIVSVIMYLTRDLHKLQVEEPE